MRLARLTFLALGVASPALAEGPLSAIGWLNEPVSVPIATPLNPPIDEPPVAQGVTTPPVTVMALSKTSSDAVGLLPASVTGLPPSVWSNSTNADLLRLWSHVRAEPIPAIQAVYYTLLLAEAEPPIGIDGVFLRARVDSLLRLGAVEPAQALLERAGPSRPELFQQWFDLTLLTGDEMRACNALKDTPTLHPDYGAQIYCTALAGDWNTAALLYDTAQVLDVLDPLEKALLALYLDPEDDTVETPRAPQSAPTPLIFRLYEAIGTPLPTRNLPLAFATADLRNTSGWKAELEAAERLVRTGALSENRLLGLYSDQDPAASGGIWDRVRAVQAFETALSHNDPTAVAETLPPVWRSMQGAHLEVAFARLFADPLSKLILPDDLRALQFRIALLTSDYEAAAGWLDPSREGQFLASLARGKPDVTLASTPVERAITRAFAPGVAPPRLQGALLAQGKLGEAILFSADQFDQAGRGDPGDIAEALSTLRSVGLEDAARRAALQMLILEPQK